MYQVFSEVLSIKVFLLMCKDGNKKTPLISSGAFSER